MPEELLDITEEEFEIGERMRYLVTEGFWEVEEDETGEFHIRKVADAAELDIPV